MAGRLREWQLMYDLAAWATSPVIAAAGEWDATHRPPDIEDLLGRPMLPTDPRDDEQDPDDAELDEEDMREDALETAEILEAEGLVARGRYTREQMARMHRSEAVT